MSNATAAAPAALKLRRILAPVDFSEACKRSAESAAELGRRFDADVVLLHAMPPIALSCAIPEALAFAPTPEFIAEQVSERAALLESLLPSATRRVVVEAAPARAIVEYARDSHCDLIVMPTHGYGALHRLVSGSITADVVRSAPCPVWTGPHCEARGFRSILCALNPTVASRPVLAWAAGFAQACGATLRISHVIPMSTVRAGGVSFDPEWHIAVAQDARRRIDTLLHDVGAEAEVMLELGDIPGAVINTAAEHSADLLVIGRGPHSYGIIRESWCPVVAV
jgi:nucleotide-binding universal stress UspA family protein